MSLAAPFIIAVCFGIPLAVFAGVLAHERWAAFCERMDKSLGYRADCFGDVPAIPDDLKVSHCGTNTTRRRNDHVR